MVWSKDVTPRRGEVGVAGDRKSNTRIRRRLTVPSERIAESVRVESIDNMRRVFHGILVVPVVVCGVAMFRNPRNNCQMKLQLYQDLCISYS